MQIRFGLVLRERIPLVVQRQNQPEQIVSGKVYEFDSAADCKRYSWTLFHWDRHRKRQEKRETTCDFWQEYLENWGRSVRRGKPASRIYMICYPTIKRPLGFMVAQSSQEDQLRLFSYIEKSPHVDGIALQIKNIISGLMYTELKLNPLKRNERGVGWYPNSGAVRSLWKKFFESRLGHSPIQLNGSDRFLQTWMIPKADVTQFITCVEEQFERTVQQKQTEDFKLGL